MITKYNIIEVVARLSNKDKKRLNNTDKEYAILELHTFNVGSVVSLKLTNNYDRYKNVSNNGSCILETSDVIFNNIIK